MQTHVRARVQMNAEFHQNVADHYRARAPGEPPTDEPAADGDVTVHDQQTEGEGGDRPVARMARRRDSKGQLHGDGTDQPEEGREPTEDEKVGQLHAEVAQQLRQLLDDDSHGRPIATDEREALPFARETRVVTRRGARQLDTRPVLQGTPRR